MPPESFRSTLVEHLDALRARDFARFAATVGDEPAVVDGRGAVVRGRDAVLSAHAAWFASPDPWSFAYETRLTREFDGAGLALIDVTYRAAPDAAPARFVLSLVFERTRDGWKFVYDQNTSHADASENP